MAQDPDKELDMVIYSEHVMAPFKKEFPNTYELMEYNMFGTLKLLQAMQILEARKFIETTAADHEGNDNIRTWSEYKIMIDKNLKKTPGLTDWRMAKACEPIAQVIHQQYFKKFPYWPAPGKTQSGYVYITCSGTHSAEKWDQKFQVTWSCEGGVKVKDKTDSSWFGLSRRYYCEMEGEPTFKILYFDLMKLKAVEGDFGEKMEKLKAKVDKLNNKEEEAEKLRQKLDALLLE